MRLTRFTVDSLPVPVYLACEPVRRATIAPACRLRGALREATDAFHEVLDGYTLADLVHPRATLSRTLFIDRARRPAPARSATP